MAVGGLSTPTQSSNEVDVISVNSNYGDQVPSCVRAPSNFPQSIQSAMGAALTSAQIPVVCGGITTEDGVLDQCYRYDAATDYWLRAGRMNTPRYGGAYVNHPTRGLIMLGGRRVPGSEYLVSVESTVDGETFDTDYPEMLDTVNLGHCAVLVDENRLIVSGGTGLPHRMQMLDLRTLRWTRMPNAQYPMVSHACGVTRNETGPVAFVTMGSFINSNYGRTVAEMDLHTGVWTGRGVFPEKKAFAASVPFEDSFVIVGGLVDNAFSGTAHRYHPGNHTWTQLTDSLSQRRRYLAAFGVQQTPFRECN